MSWVMHSSAGNLYFCNTQLSQRNYVMLIIKHYNFFIVKLINISPVETIPGVKNKVENSLVSSSTGKFPWYTINLKCWIKLLSLLLLLLLLFYYYCYYYYYYYYSTHIFSMPYARLTCSAWHNFYCVFLKARAKRHIWTALWFR